ncbi:tyrosine-type recombinase/integrase [Sulfitobacter sp. D35]|uniref:tyrosine-type recombinase/integrase n=1 Tax=Sulfitobacter sp. D35 TaxID=3083252 RepID=UPI00296F7D69|nr:tyrosine-type recombinase/integrase [Sulfitobacter sp. D35]MDW4496555.1 tyrosine-type recombinase/integrase [Sulfitobacter sp. D35]
MPGTKKLPKNVYQPPNSKFYWLRVKIKGVTYRESLRTTSVSVAEKGAKRRLKELRALDEAGGLDRTFSAGVVKFYDLLEQDNSGWGKQTRKRYQTSVRQILRVMEHICDGRNLDVRTIQAEEVDVAIVSEFVARRRSEKVSNSTVNRDLTAFLQLMTSMKNDGWISENPVRLFEKQGMKEVLPGIVMPTEAAISRLCQRAPGTLAFFPRFLDATGGRVTEMARLKWSDISGMENPTAGSVYATLTNTKGGKVRTIELSPKAIDILRQIPRSNAGSYVFWNSTEHGFYKDPSNLFWEYGQETGFEARLHDLRHKFAIERLREGWSVYKVQKYIGHGSVLTTERYYFRYLSQEQQERARSDGDNGFR